MIRIEHVQQPSNLVICDYRHKGRQSKEYMAGWGVFTIAVAIILYTLGLVALTALYYVLPSPASQSWVNHEFHMLYGFAVNAAALSIAFVVVKWWRVPFGWPLFGMALVELVVGYALMFAMPRQQWIPALAVVLATRIAFAVVLRRGILHDAG